MAHDIVMRAVELILVVTAHLDESRIGIQDAAFEIRAGNQVLVVAKHILVIGDGTRGI